MSDKSELKAELERKKQRIAQIREEKKRKEEEKKKKDVRTVSGLVWLFSVITYAFCVDGAFLVIVYLTVLHVGHFKAWSRVWRCVFCWS